MMKLNSTRPLLLTAMLAASFALSAQSALAAPKPTATAPSVVYQTQPASEVQLISGDPLIWVDVPGLSATVALPSNAAVVVAYNVTVQNQSAEACTVLLRAVIADVPYTQTLFVLPPGMTSSGGQTVANPSLLGSVTAKIQATTSAAPGSCQSVFAMTVPYGAGGTANTWGSTMTVMVR